MSSSSKSIGDVIVLALSAINLAYLRSKLILQLEKKNAIMQTAVEIKTAALGASEADVFIAISLRFLSESTLYIDRWAPLVL
jgi:hypothetical protein